MNAKAILNGAYSGSLDNRKTCVRSGTLSSGITAKMDAFARHVAEGMSLADAYRQAFNTAKMKPKTVRDDASRLARHPGVRAALEAYRADIEARIRMFSIDREERIWRRLWGLIEDDEVPPAVRVRALDLAARLSGMFLRPCDQTQFAYATVERKFADLLSAGVPRRILNGLGAAFNAGG